MIEADSTNTASSEQQALGRRLLIIQRNQHAAHSFARYLRHLFDNVQIASGHESAQRIIEDQSLTPTHLLCGYYFGEDESGAEWIQRWRRQCPQLQRVVVATDESHLPHDLTGVDALFVKPVDPSQLAALLTK